MAKKMKMAYWLLPAAALCVAAVGLAITPSYAHYETDAAWYTVATPEKVAVSSPFLAEKDRNLTVLAGELTGEGKEISFALESTGNTAGSLQWQVDKPDFLEITVQAGETALVSGDALQLAANTPAQIKITVTPTEKAAQPHEKMTADLQLSFGENLAGTFRVELAAVEETMTETPEENAPVEEVGAETPEKNNPVETVEETQLEQTEPEETQPEQTEPEETQPEETQPEQTEPEETQPEQTEPEETQPEQTEPEETPPVSLSAPAAWNPVLPVPVKVTAQIDQVVSLQLFAEDALQPMPAATRFSIDNGATWFALYAPGKAEIQATAGQTQTLLLDIGHTELKNATELTLAAADGVQAGISFNAVPLYELSANAMTQSGAVTLTFPAFLNDTTILYSIDILTAAEEGTVYLPATLNAGALQAELTQTEEGQQLKLSIGEKLPPAGTYRLNLRLQAGDVPIKETEEHFFIHYGEASGGERQ